ncbi:C2 domain-containing protein [Hordeum vulgare]|nr:C2 domain-containing protein [Hordeum vulgare]
MTTAPSSKGKPRAPHKTAVVPKMKKTLTPEQHARESTKRKGPLEAFKVQHNGKCFNLSHCFRVIKVEEKFKAQYAALKSRGGKKAVEEVGDDEKAQPRGKTNFKKEDKRDATSNALIASVEGVMRKKDSREEGCRRYKEEQMNTFMEIQRRRLEMDAEKQAKMLKMERRRTSQDARDRGRSRKDQGERSDSREHDDRGGDHEGGSQHRATKEEVVVREDACQHAQVLQG